MVPFSSRGEWSSVTVKDLPQLKGLGTGSIRWGTPIDSKFGPSGYDFKGTSSTAPLDGTDFVLGTFRHHNSKLHDIPTYQWSLYLDVWVEFEVSQADPFEYYFRCRLHHYETPGPDEPDEVRLPKIEKQDVLSIDDVDYQMEITGFWTKGKSPAPTFHTPENSDSREVRILAKLTQVSGRDSGI